MSRRSWPRVIVAMMSALPLGAVSRLAGRIARLRLPAPLQRAQIRVLGRLFGVDFGEVADPLGSFTSFQDFFTRQLRDGVRPIDSSPDALVAPCDGAWGASGRIEGGQLLQIKGRPYSLARLLGSEEDAKRFEGGWYATLYLAPRDYHRFHTPCAVEVRAARYLPGTLLPVNAIGLEGQEGLFSENERICAHMALAPFVASAEPALCLVAVGATLVGSVKVTFDDLRTNRPGGEPMHRTYAPGEIRLEKGAEWGRFEFGSTLVLLATAEAMTLDSPPAGTLLRLGTRIGTLAGMA